MDRLLLINDLTNNVLERYIAFKAGDFSATAEINPAFAGKDTAAAKDRAKEVSLIDFDDQEEVTTLPSNPTGSNIQQLDGLLNSISISSAEPSTETKTLGGGLPGNLFFDPTPLQEISRSTKQPGPSTGHNFFSPQNAQAPSSWGTGLGSSMNQNISPDVTGAISLGGTSSSSKFPQPGSTSAVRATPNHSLPSLTPSNPSSVQSRPMSTAPSNMSSTNPNNTTTATSKPPVNDPFADLVGLFWSHIHRWTCSLLWLYCAFSLSPWIHFFWKLTLVASPPPTRLFFSRSLLTSCTASFDSNRLIITITFF